MDAMKALLVAHRPVFADLSIQTDDGQRVDVPFIQASWVAAKLAAYCVDNSERIRVRAAWHDLNLVEVAGLRRMWRADPTGTSYGGHGLADFEGMFAPPVDPPGVNDRDTRALVNAMTGVVFAAGIHPDRLDARIIAAQVRDRLRERGWELSPVPAAGSGRD